MTRWSYDEVRELYKRAEVAEDALMMIVDKMYDWTITNPPGSIPDIENAIEVLRKCQRIDIKEKIAAHEKRKADYLALNPIE